MKTKPRILLIYHDADLVTRKTFAALRDRGFEVTIAAPADDKADTCGLPTVAIRPIKNKFAPGAARDIRRAIKNLRIDTVFAVSTSALSNTLMATWLTKTKTVGYRGTQARVHFFDPTYRMALLNPRVNHIVCETADIREYLALYINCKNLSWRPKPYDRAWVAGALKNPKGKTCPDGLSISYVGITKGRPHKGLNYLVEAMHLLKEKGINAHLTVVGAADEADIARAGDNVTFMGNRPDAVNFIAGSDVFVLPSTRDASPRVVREAQACGVPCIVTRIPGAEDLIETGSPSGILVPPADPAAIADACKTLLNDPALRAEMSENAIKNIDKNFRTDDYTDYFENLFTTLHNGK